MKKIVAFCMFLAITGTAFSQFFDNAVRFELRYPIPVGDNFINTNPLVEKGYTGILDAGVEYNILEMAGFGAGVAFNTTVLRLSEVELTATGFLPKIFAEYEIRTDDFSIIPQAGFGYARWRFKGPDTEFTDDNGNPVTISNKTAENGWSAEASVKFLRTSAGPVNWFIQASWSFTRLEKPSVESMDTDFNRNISLIYPGVGLVWRF